MSPVIYSTGDTPLHMACTTGNLSLCKLLLEAGGSIVVSNHKGETPVETALRFGRMRCVDLLERIGPDVVATSPTKKTPMKRSLARLDHMDLVTSRRSQDVKAISAAAVPTSTSTFPSTATSTSPPPADSMSASTSSSAASTSPASASTCASPSSPSSPATSASNPSSTSAAGPVSAGDRELLTAATSHTPATTSEHTAAPHTQEHTLAQADAPVEVPAANATSAPAPAPAPAPAALDQAQASTPSQPIPTEAEGHTSSQVESGARGNWTASVTSPRRETRVRSGTTIGKKIAEQPQQPQQPQQLQASSVSGSGGVSFAAAPSTAQPESTPGSEAGERNSTTTSDEHRNDREDGAWAYTSPALARRVPAARETGERRFFVGLASLRNRAHSAASPHEVSKKAAVQRSPRNKHHTNLYATVGRAQSESTLELSSGHSPRNSRQEEHELQPHTLEDDAEFIVEVHGGRAVRGVCSVCPALYALFFCALSRCAHWCVLAGRSVRRVCCGRLDAYLLLSLCVHCCCFLSRCCACAVVCERVFSGWCVCCALPAALSV
jgi:Ankyrin repeats (3 copies)